MEGALTGRAEQPPPGGYDVPVVERRTQAERRAESRDRLIKAAIRLLAERGYAHASLVEIGRAAGFSRGLVNHHFGSKEACMRAVVEHIRNTAGLRTQKLGGRGADAIAALIDSYFDTLVDPANVNAQAMYVILVEGLTATPGLRAAVAETNALTRSFIAGHVAEMFDVPVDRGDGDPEVRAIATVIEGILRGVAVQWLADPDNVDLDAVKTTTKLMINSAVSSLELRR
ncbi:TetR family transcriptional regulator [Streptomyces sp. NPDC008092]|uniref:TetR/AcrR family transcriptional regulator n=1 Tax=Streptomyces sp. NPDC008092 TaxID=3364808 RepID=UPI0036ECC8D1